MYMKKAYQHQSSIYRKMEHGGLSAFYRKMSQETVEPPASRKLPNRSPKQSPLEKKQEPEKSKTPTKYGMVSPSSTQFQNPSALQAK